MKLNLNVFQHFANSFTETISGTTKNPVIPETTRKPTILRISMPVISETTNNPTITGISMPVIPETTRNPTSKPAIPETTRNPSILRISEPVIPDTSKNPTITGISMSDISDTTESTTTSVISAPIAIGTVIGILLIAVIAVIYLKNAQEENSPSEDLQIPEPTEYSV